MKMQPRYIKSLALWQESQKSLVPGGSTISKRPDLYSLGAYPIYLKQGKGCMVSDIDGNRYIDFQGSLGANILGLAYPDVEKAVIAQLKKGCLLSLAHPLAVELSQKLCELIPSAERVRILKNGSDATSAAIRIARAFTRKQKVLFCHFHGWHDWYYVITSMNRGINPELKQDIISLPYNDITELKKSLKTHKNEVAALIMEPINLIAPKPGYLQQVKEICKKHGVILIFDEVVTGFRYGLSGAQGYVEVTPDLTCLAKALGNGAPIAAVVGKANIMDSTQDVVTSMTYAEDCLALASALATLKVLENKPVAEHIWRLGSQFQEGFNQLAEKYQTSLKCIGLPPRLEITYSDSGTHTRKELKAFFLQETAKQGILFGLHVFVTYSHTDKHIKQALSVCEKVFKRIHRNFIKLEGELPVELW